jgi:hypothetical protein
MTTKLNDSEKKERRKKVSDLDHKAIRAMQQLHKIMGLGYTMTISSYTIRIVSEYADIMYMKQDRGIQTFKAYSKLKSDVQGKDVAGYDEKYIRYFQTNFNFNEIYADEIYNIDIKSAYAAILYNESIITESTFAFLKTLSKIDRLAAVGMLAGRSASFSFDNTGKILSHEEKKNENSRYFFYAVQKTFEVMDYCKQILGNDFYFSWVDSLYFRSEDKAQAIQDILKEQFNLDTSFKRLTEFELKTTEDTHKISFKEDDEEKTFNIPVPYSNFRKQEYTELLIEIREQYKKQSNENLLSEI